MSDRARKPNDAANVGSHSRELGRAVSAAAALEDLFETAVSLPFAKGARAVTSRILDRASALLPAHAVGACIVEPSTREQFVEMRIPDGIGPPGRDPSRLFPNLANEVIVPLDGLEGSTLHVASEASAISEGSNEHVIATRSAQLLSTAVGVADSLTADAAPNQDVKDLQSQLIQAEKLASLGQIVAGVVHELANPLTSIVAYADYLLKKARSANSDNADIERLERIGEAAQRILKFSRDLVAYARPATEEPGPVSIHEVIHQAIIFCEHEFSRNEVELSLHLTEGVPAVRGMPGPLAQIFVNLFTNAAHAMGDHGGRLEVRTKYVEARKEVRIEILDTGIGIQPDALTRVFEPFFTTKEKTRGTGLGLAIVKDIVDAHEGTVDAASTPGEGTTFQLTLPIYGTRRSRPPAS